MRSKNTKYRSDLFKKDVVMVIDEQLNMLQGKILAPKKLEVANKTLKKLKNTLPR